MRLKMEKHKSNKWKLVVGVLAVLVLTACSTGSTSVDAGADSGAGNEEAQIDGSQGAESTEAEIGRDGAFRLGDAELPALMQLTLGIFQLESTKRAVNADQAGEMLPLWKAYRSLSSSDTVAQVELEAVVNQIQELLTADQIAAISSMELTQEDVQSMIEGLGIEFRPPEGFDGEGFNPDQFRQQFGGGGPGGGQGGAFGGQGNFDPNAAATARAEAGIEGEVRGGFGGRAGIFLLDPLIDLLEERAGFEGL
jgi:hypothetical protein